MGAVYPNRARVSGRVGRAGSAVPAGDPRQARRPSTIAEPLPAVEARAIANSIHRWITTRSRMWKDGAAVYEATFVAIQSARGKKSGRARAARRDQRTEAMLEYMRGKS
ncbi:hypothetical protein [Streptomyces sp. enrichment culture]|uniref:hypothetical protein n=1 Tax=Streptomyces sp. enrichment culture TaxID=1795815 RepID=UPI003F56B5DC